VLVRNEYQVVLLLQKLGAVVEQDIRFFCYQDVRGGALIHLLGTPPLERGVAYGQYNVLHLVSNDFIWGVGGIYYVR